MRTDLSLIALSGMIVCFSFAAASDLRAGTIAPNQSLVGWQDSTANPFSLAANRRGSPCRSTATKTNAHAGGTGTGTNGTR